MKVLKNIPAALSVALVALVLTSPASAQIDTSFVTGMSSDFLTGVAAIGGAFLLMAGGTVAYKWLRGFTFS